MFLPVLLEIVSCKSTSHKRELEQVDSLQKIMDETRAKFSSIDSSEIRKRYDLMLYNMAVVYRINSDTLDPETEILVAEYRFIKNLFKSYLKRRPDLQLGIDYSVKQLGDLEGSIRDGSLDMSKFREYYATEMLAAEELKVDAGMLADELKLRRQQYDTLHPKMDLFVKKLIEVVKVDTTGLNPSDAE